MAALLADWTVSRVAEFRTALGLSQVALAERVGISRPTLAKIEEGGGTKHSTINFLVTRLQEEFGDQFESIRLMEVGPNRFDLDYTKKDMGTIVPLPRQVPSWGGELNALSRKIMEVTNAKNAAYLPAFHSELVEILESYKKLSGLTIFEPDD